MELIKSIIGRFSKGKSEVYGDCGRLEIKNLGIGVRLYSSQGKSKQKIVDDENSAVVIRWGSRLVIADHNYQSGFDRLKNSQPGKTTAVIKKDGSEESYICVLNETGHIKNVNGKNLLYDNQWRPVYDLQFGDICVYTCLERVSDDVVDVVLTFWGKIKAKGESGK